MSTKEGRGKNRIISAGSLVAQLIRDNPKKFGKVPQHPISEYTPLFEPFDLAGIALDRGYQRPPKEELIEKITDDFDPNAVVTPVVARRMWLPEDHEHRHSAIEGQQRIISMLLVGITVGYCIVVEVQSVDEEMELFDKINRYRRAVSAADHHKHDVARGEEKAVALEAAIKPTGFRIIRYGEKSDITGVQKLHEVAETYCDEDILYDYGVVTKALLDFRAIWCRNQDEAARKRKSVPANVIAGLACLQHAYSEHAYRDGRPLSADLLAKNLAPMYPTLSRLSKAYSKTGRKRGEAGDRALAHLMADAYNAQANKKDAIPPRVMAALAD